MSYQSVYTLASEMKSSQAYEEYKRLKEEIEEDETQRLLLKEYRAMQMQLQMSAITKQSPPQEQMDRFSALNSLLYANPKVSAYLLAEMRLQQALAEVIKILTESLELSFDVPNL